jgi:hypothetical protein
LSSLRQNIITRPMGKTKTDKHQIDQMPWMWKHQELEKWKTQGPIWRNSTIYLQRLRSQVFTFGLISQPFSFFIFAQEVS